MATMRLSFSGEVRKPQTKEIGGKPAIEFQIMRKNYVSAGSEPTFTWIRCTLFSPQPWQIDQCQEGKFICGSGEFTLRSYVNKDGQKVQSAECRVQSFDIDGPRTDERPAASAPSPTPRRPAPVADDLDSPPF